MKKIICVIFTCCPLILFAQDKPANHSLKRTTMQDTTAYFNKKKKTEPFAHKDTLKMNIPKDNNFNPSNAKLRNSKIKTPLSDNNLKGTNAPGDPNTGLPPAKKDHASSNEALDKVKAIKDSTNNIQRPD